MEIAEFLIEKNNLYGNSALSPICIFSQLTTEEQLNVRIDDKLNRIRNINQRRLQDSFKEDTELDLIGYLILKRVLKRFRNGGKKD